MSKRRESKELFCSVRANFSKCDDLRHLNLKKLSEIHPEVIELLQWKKDDKFNVKNHPGVEFRVSFNEEKDTDADDELEMTVLKKVDEDFKRDF